MELKTIVYEHRTDLLRLRKFLWWSWWSKFAEGGTVGHTDKGKLLRVVYNNTKETEK